MSMLCEMLKEWKRKKKNYEGSVVIGQGCFQVRLLCFARLAAWKSTDYNYETSATDPTSSGCDRHPAAL